MNRAFALALIASVAAACGGHETDIEASIRFEDLSEVEIARLINAASGSDVFQAQAQVLAFSDPFDLDEQSDCPIVTISGSTVSIAGGCSVIDGPTLVGQAAVTNPIGWDPIEYNFGDDQVYEFYGFRIEQLGFASEYDGIATIAPGYDTLEADITVDFAGIVVRSDLYFDCDAGGCDIEGSGVELVGVGGAHVSGSLSVSSVGGSYTLRGEDTLRVEITQGCVAWEIEGTARTSVCVAQ
jgi:hypothetical protein